MFCNMQRNSRAHYQARAQSRGWDDVEAFSGIAFKLNSENSSTRCGGAAGLRFATHALSSAPSLGRRSLVHFVCAAKCAGLSAFEFARLVAYTAFWLHHCAPSNGEIFFGANWCGKEDGIFELNLDCLCLKSDEKVSINTLFETKYWLMKKDEIWKNYIKRSGTLNFKILNAFSDADLFSAKQFPFFIAYYILIIWKIKYPTIFDTTEGLKFFYSCRVYADNEHQVFKYIYNFFLVF